MGTLELKQIRQLLHQFPEVSNHEEKTAAYIEKQLLLVSPDKIISNIGGYGILAQYTSDKPGKHILLRCELDALPIQEINDFQHRSKTQGISHKCGHDGHMTILLGVADELHDNPLKEGTVSLLFQPAEETGEGAKRVLSDEQFHKHCRPDFVLALHNYPDYDKGTVIVKPNAFTASVISCKITFKGKSSHAAEPENGINPAYAIAEIIAESKSLQEVNTNDKDFGLVTPVYGLIGEEAFGVSPGNGELGFTIRSWTDERRQFLQESLNKLIKKMEQKHQLEATVEWFEEFNSVNNDPITTDAIHQSAKELGLQAIENSMPFKWGEDFGLFTKQFQGAMFCLGSGITTPALHNPDYDFPDEISPVGVQMMLNTIKLLQTK